MAWGNKVQSREVREYRQTATEIIHEMEANGYKFHFKTVVTLQLYNFIKKCSKDKIISPAAFPLIARKYTEIYEMIYRNEWAKLRGMLEELNKGDYLDKIIVTIFYGNYWDTCSLFRAILRTYHYKFQKFTREEIMGVFKKYPFLSTPEHLEHIRVCLSHWAFPSRITQYGIKERYEKELFGVVL